MPHNRGALLTGAGFGRVQKRSICVSSCEVAGLLVLEKYELGPAKICITQDGQYLVNEPPLTAEALSLYDSVVARINLGMEIESGEDIDTISGRFTDAFWEVAERMKRLEDAQRLFPHLDYYIRRNFVGYGLLDPLMRDANIEDILCSAPDRPIRVVHKRYSGMFDTLHTNVSFPDDESMRNYIQKVFGRTGAEPTESRPMSVTHMEDGSRISATFGSQVSKPGCAIAIRRFPSRPYTVTDMILNRTMTPRMAAYLWTLLDAKAVGLIIGVTGSGKTTLLSSLVSMLNPRWRILTIEDTLEMQIPHTDWVRLNTRKSYGMMGEEFDVTVRNLIDISLTQRPDYEIVGETRLYDMDALFQSVGTGHGGLTSFHASSPLGALTRMRGGGIGEGELGLLWFVAHVSRVRLAGSYYRRVSDISEIVPGSGGVSIRPVFDHDVFSDKFGGAGPEGSRRYGEALRICGIDDPAKDMARRTALLERCVREDARTPAGVFAVLGRYYKWDESEMGAGESEAA